MKLSRHRNAAGSDRSPLRSRTCKRSIRAAGTTLAGTVLLALATLALYSGKSAPRTVHAAAPPTAPAQVTYAQIAPILKRECAACHNPQGGAPFSLESYPEAKQWGEQMLEVTQNRYMPPWLPAPGHGEFQGARRLTESELADIRAWVGAGMPEGTASAAAKPAREAAAPAAAWKLGAPDLVLQLASPVALAGSGPDTFLNLIVPYTGSAAHKIRAVEIRASDPQAVRSIWLQVDPKAAFRHAHATDWQSGVPGMEPPDSIQAQLTSPGGLLFWTPDAPVLSASAHGNWAMDPGNDLVLTTHLKTTGHSEAVQLTVAVYYAKGGGAAARGPEVLELQPAENSLEIPAGAAGYELHGQFTLPAPVRAQAIYPRAHFLGKELNAYAELPNGQRQWLISIPKWDVDWQSVYRYTRPVALPKGAVVHWRYIYDNSSDNPHNPSDPPQAVHAGVTPADEIDQLWLELVPSAGLPNTSAWSRSLENAVRQQRGATEGQPANQQKTGNATSSSSESGR